jgi:hypothetical protein
MSRTSFLMPILLLLLAGGPVLGQRKEDIRFESGNIRVTRQVEQVDMKAGPQQLGYCIILRDHVDFGRCFEDAKYRRMPITYYHPQGPVGLAFQKLNWFGDTVNSYHADARLPASFAAAGATSAMAATFPTAGLAAMWSEPPVAVIGMNAGTPAAYARPYQHFHFYEPTREVIELNERRKAPFFHFIPDARARGADIHIVHGSPRQQLRKLGPTKFYHLMILEACSGENGEKIFLDLFTREGIAQCLEHIADDGILCVHTSHRFVDLPPVLAAIGKELKLHVRRGRDQAPGNRRQGGGEAELAEAAHFSSEWVLMARNEGSLEAVCKPPANYDALLKKAGNALFEDFWTVPEPLLERAWTDKRPNLLNGVLRGHPFAMRYSAAARPCAEFFANLVESPNLKRAILDLSHLPRPVDEWLVWHQLKTNPQVEKLWR